MMVRFGSQLREIREGRGISQEKLADLASLHRTYVSSVERGKNNISLINIERLAVALGVPMRDLMPADAPPSKPDVHSTKRKSRVARPDG
ncbi:MAG: helix-turn-helix transcriptional regulator [Gemmataceae bacterium]